MNNGDGNVQGNPVAQKAGKLINTRSKFNKLGYPFFTTNRFGEITPFYVLDNVFGDHNNSLLSSSKVDSYTLKVPLMQDVRMHKDLYYVPLQAILPENWEKWVTNPNIGEDCPDDCGTGVQSFWSRICAKFRQRYIYLSEEYSLLNDESPIEDYRSLLAEVIRFFVVGEYFFSSGNLLKQLGISGDKYWNWIDPNALIAEDYRRYNWDSLFDHFFSLISDTVNAFTIETSDGVYVVSASGLFTGTELDRSLSFREFLDLLRDDPMFFNFTDLDEDANSYGFSIANVTSLLDDFFAFSFEILATESDHLDLQRIMAYQLVCSHFYTNDHVDYIYSAELFRQYIKDLIMQNGDDISAVGGFTVNGIYYRYDPLSAHCCVEALFEGSPFFSYGCTYAAAIFSYRHSLRFVDYFVSSRTQPLAVGNHDMDTDVAVNNNVASVIDITRKIMAQKFLNAVQRVGRKIGDYSHILGGDGMKPDFHNPLWIGQTVDVIYGDRSEYTGNVENAEQNNITSLLKNAGGKYVFNWEIDRVGVAIGVCYYDIERVYTELSERQTFNLNRFDMFNPYLQFVGDQAIYQSELMTGGQVPFGYGNRHIEYKLRVPRAAGGFVSDSGLPSWIFSAERGFRKYEDHQSPSFIRSFNSEFDQFYVSLTGYSLGTYFHFIVRHINVASSSRPMAVAPDILQ